MTLISGLHYNQHNSYSFKIVNKNYHVTNQKAPSLPEYLVNLIAFFNFVASGEETDKHCDDCISNLISLMRKKCLKFSLITSIKRSNNLDSIFFSWLNTSLVFDDSASKSQGSVKSKHKGNRFFLGLKIFPVITRINARLI